MEFKLRFVTDPYKYVVNTETMGLPKTVGLQQLSHTRAALKTRFHASIMEEEIERLLLDPIITISEKIARKSGLFETTSTEEIYISAEKKEEFFERFIIRKISIKKNESSKKLERVSLHYALHKKALIEDWIKKGFPTKII